MKKCNQKWFNPQKVKKQIAIAVAISLVCAIPISTFAQVLKFSIKKITRVRKRKWIYFFL